MRLSRLIGLVLAAGCGLLVLVALLLGAGLGTGIAPEGDPSDYARPVGDLDPVERFRMPDFDEAYAVISEAPLFNEDRQPAPNVPVEVETAGPGPEGPEPVPLDVRVKGIIITPAMKLAIVTDARSKETLRLREGMPLEGEMGAWTLTEIAPRKLVFDGDSMGTAEVELEVHTKALAGGGSATRTKATPAAQQEEKADEQTAQQQSPSEPDAAERRAEEIRRRVAERRAQLRAEAERRRQQQTEEQ